MSARRLPDWIPKEAGLPEGLPSLGSAVTYLHRPPREAQLAELAAGRHPAQRRLAFEELLAHHLSLKVRKRTAEDRPGLGPDRCGGTVARASSPELPFALTGAQQRALKDAECDLVTGVPMARLVQGDVGCGKTVVAAAAAARAAGSGFQATLMGAMSVAWSRCRRHGPPPRRPPRSCRSHVALHQARHGHAGYRSHSASFSARCCAPVSAKGSPARKRGDSPAASVRAQAGSVFSVRLRTLSER